MKDIKDYLHLYLGCELLILKTDEIIEFDELQTTNHWPIWTRNKKYCNNNGSVASGFRFKEIKPILRPLSDMTDEEESYFDTELWEYASKYKCYSPEQFVYFLKKGFDLFGLIESGLAVDKTKINKP